MGDDGTKTKRRPTEEESERREHGPFDDLVLHILSRLGASARCPPDIISVLLTCRRLRRLGLSPQVLNAVSSETFSLKGWTGPALSFLKRCAGSGNTAACNAVSSTDRWITSLEERLSRVEQLGAL